MGRKKNDEGALAEVGEKKTRTKRVYQPWWLTTAQFTEEGPLKKQILKLLDAGAGDAVVETLARYFDDYKFGCRLRDGLHSEGGERGGA